MLPPTARLAIKIDMTNIDGTKVPCMEISVPLSTTGISVEYSQAILRSMRRLFRRIQQQESSSQQALISFT